MTQIKQWDVWYFDQVASRMRSDPQQPKDPSGKTRMYVVVCPNAHIVSGGWPVAIPIGTKSRSKLLDAEIKAGEGGVKHDCFAWCNEIYTLNPAYFRQNMGTLPDHCQTDIKDGLRDFLEIY